MRRLFNVLCWLGIFLSGSGITCIIVATRVHGHDAAMAHAEWYNKQTMNEAARKRLAVPYKSCCDHADVYKTRFRVAEDNSDQWQYLKDGKWKTIPSDIIKEEDTPDREPVLFINRHDGTELCFFLPRGGT